MIRLAPGELDLYRFESLLSRGRAALGDADAAEASQRLHEALMLWRGPALADFAPREVVWRLVRKARAL